MAELLEETPFVIENAAVTRVGCVCIGVHVCACVCDGRRVVCRCVCEGRLKTGVYMQVCV